MQNDRSQEFHVRRTLSETSPPRESRHTRARSAVWQARLIMLVMINIAQLWILAATVDAALAHHFSVLLPLVISSGICFLITLSIIRWWRPTSGKRTSTGYVRTTGKER
jgi:hypothetical protein